ncbi:IS5 family transposase [Chloroflexi bacterium TSY]|nr:IS5 family transposase [Chloroflexi bacterium TSY]
MRRIAKIRSKLNNSEWRRISRFLRSCKGIYVGRAWRCRRFVNGVLWIARTGSQWRELPERYGNWNSVYKRFARWDKAGIWERMFLHFADDPEMESLLLDSRVIRAHPCAAGAPAAQGGQEAQALGRSRGGFSTKIHVAVHALGLPLDFVLTAGQRHDITQAPTLLKGHKATYVIADKSYDSDHFLQLIRESDALPVIPARQNRTESRDYDEHLYKERHLVECFINKIKWYRRIFVRYEKLDSRYLSFLYLVSSLSWLR